MIGRLTLTARRHNADAKANIDGSEVIVGTNHQGLGYESSYSSQLTPVAQKVRYGNSNDNEQRVRDILFNDKIVIDLTAIIKKSNQKTFLKTMRILKKFNLVKAFHRYKAETLEKIEIPLADNKHKIVINIERNFSTTFSIKDIDGVDIFETSFSNDEDKPIIKVNEEECDLLKPISKTSTSRFSISDIKRSIFLTQHKEVIIEAIKSKRKLLNSVKDTYADEHKQLNELLQPLLALEKL